MIGTRTPFRVSFAGGGSDLRSFYCRQPGSVLSTSINKYMYILVHPFFDQRIQVKYSKTELVRQGFDPGTITDLLYFDFAEAGAFVPLDNDLYHRIQSRGIRL